MCDVRNYVLYRSLFIYQSSDPSHTAVSGAQYSRYVRRSRGTWVTIKLHNYTFCEHPEYLTGDSEADNNNTWTYIHMQSLVN